MRSLRDARWSMMRHHRGLKPPGYRRITANAVGYRGVAAERPYAGNRLHQLTDPHAKNNLSSSLSDVLHQIRKVLRR